MTQTSKSKKRYSVLTWSLTILFLLVITGCRPGSDGLPINLNPPPAANKRYMGFNAKGTNNTVQQVAYTKAYLEGLPTSVRSNIAIRVTGGTVSQTTYSDDWTPAMIQAWVNLQTQLGIRFIFVVNGNDTPVHQKDLIQRWLVAGAKFDFIEMMNEYYLTKYAEGDISKPEVKRKITPEDYANIMLPLFWEELDQFNLPYYIIFAPTRLNPIADARTRHWNNVMIDQVINHYPNRNLNATLHLYTSGHSDEDDDIDIFNYKQIDTLRKRLPVDRRIAITEAGVLDSTISIQELTPIAILHHKHIDQHLQKGDYLFDQVLYNPIKDNNTTDLSPWVDKPDNDHTTVKGVAVRSYFKESLE